MTWDELKMAWDDLGMTGITWDDLGITWVNFGMNFLYQEIFILFSSAVDKTKKTPPKKNLV